MRPDAPECCAESPQNPPHGGRASGDAAEREESLLAGLLFDPDALGRVGDLSPNDFERPDHGRLFSALVALREKGIEPDADALVRRLANGCAAERWERLLARLLDQAATAETVGADARAVKLAGIERQLRRLHRDRAEDLDHQALGDEIAVLERERAALLDGTPRRRRLRAATFDEIMEDTTPEPLVERLLYEGTPTLFCGLPKRGKSYTAAHLALCLASGRDFLGLRVRRSRVLYVSYELSLSPIRDRLRAIARDLGFPDPLPLLRDGWCQLFGHRRAAEAAGLDLTTDEGWRDLGDLCEDAAADILVIDTLSRVVGIEMKDTRGWQETMGRLNRFCREQPVSALIIDHAHRGRMEENASTVAMGSQTKGSTVPVIAKLTESKHDDPLEKRWRLDVDSWYGDAAAPVWFRRPEVERDGCRLAGSGCVLADAPDEPHTTTRTGACAETLREYLARRHRLGVAWVPKSDVVEALGERFAERTIERAFSEKLKGRSDKDYQGKAIWALPED